MEIEGYPNYLIYEDGKVFSKKRNKFLKPRINTNGYYCIDLCENGKQKTYKIHRLIAIHYIPNPENKREVDHINRDRSDNKIENLRWVSHLENMQNKGIPNTNTSGIKNISYNKFHDRWIFRKEINGKLTRKSFKTKQEAIEFKNHFVICNTTVDFPCNSTAKVSSS